MRYKLFPLWITPNSSNMDQNHILKVDQNDIFPRDYGYYSYKNLDPPSIESGSNLSTFQSGSKYYYMIPSQIVGWDPPTQIFVKWSKQLRWFESCISYLYRYRLWFRVWGDQSSFFHSILWKLDFLRLQENKKSWPWSFHGEYE